MLTAITGASRTTKPPGFLGTGAFVSASGSIFLPGSSAVGFVSAAADAGDGCHSGRLPPLAQKVSLIGRNCEAVHSN